jgi:hypothetical protein
MKLLPRISLASLKSLLLIITLAKELLAQKRPAAVPEASIFASWGLYVGLVAIGILVAVAVKLRKKNAADAKPLDLVPDDGIRLTYKGKGHAKKNKVTAPEMDEYVPSPVYAQFPAKTGFAALPISTFVRLPKTNPYLQLPGSSEPVLMEAIEMTSEESDCDTSERSKALDVLSKFRTPNSIAAISQMALYDLSTKLRSEAVSVLAELDHESVFDTIVTACADPSREVRAAAARAFVKIGFDRSQSWTRIVESRDPGRMKHAARSAIEGDIVARSFDRLVHTDRSIAYEAYALTALLIRSGETEPIYKALASHRDENVKLALLHVLQTIKEDETFERLDELLTRVNFKPDVAAKVQEVMSCLQLTHA